MVRRVYFCTNDDCDNQYEKQQSINEIDKICDKCGSNVFQDLSNIYSSTSCRTLGILAEKNSNSLGSAGVSEIIEKQNIDFENKRAKEREVLQEKVPGIKFPEKKKKDPWFGKLPKKVEKEIFSKKGKDQHDRVQKYIHEGK